MSAEANPTQAVPEHDFAKAVEESKASIAAQELVPPKRGRGRPRKGPESGAQRPTMNQPIMATGAMPASPPPNIASYLEFPLIAISKGPAKKHDLPELALTPEEAKACAEALQACLNAFIPDVNNMRPKTGAIVGLIMTAGSIGFTKYQLLADKQAAELKKNPPKPEPEIQEEIAKQQDAAGVPADSYFRR